MDICLTHSFRLVFNDIILIYDVISISFTIAPRKNNGPSANQSDGHIYSITSLAKSLAILINTESNEKTSVNSSSHIDNKPNAKSLRNNIKKLNSNSNLADLNENDLFWGDLLREFLQTVVLKFSLEELSQYPFWAAKVIVICQDNNSDGRASIGIISSLIKSMKDFKHVLIQRYLDGGLKNIYIGSAPYLAASVIQNFVYIEYTFRKFLSTISSFIPPITSHDQMQLHTPDIHKRSLNSSNLKPIDVEPPIQLSMLGKFVIAGLSHPLICLTISMLQSPVLKGQNWFMSMLKVVSSNGIGGFYKGLRVATFFSLMPFSPLYLFGIAETITYKCMVGVSKTIDYSPITKEVIGQANTKKLEITHYRNLVNTILRDDNMLMGLFRYGFLTTAQILPGFASFVCARAVLFLAFGSSRQRCNQLEHRREILENFWNRQNKQVINPHSDLKNSINQINSTTNNINNYRVNSNNNGIGLQGKKTSRIKSGLASRNQSQSHQFGTVTTPISSFQTNHIFTDEKI